MNDQEYSSLYGFCFKYPAHWSKKYNSGRALFAEPGTHTAQLSLSVIQTKGQTTTKLEQELHKKLEDIPHAEILKGSPISVNGIAGYSYLVDYVDTVVITYEHSEQMPRRALVVGLPFQAGSLTLLFTFSNTREGFTEFEQQAIRPILDSFVLDAETMLLPEGYRRFARDEYGVALNFPEMWLMTGITPEHAAFRSLSQRWQIDNVTLVTSLTEEKHSLRDYCALARLSFKSDPKTEIIKEYKSQLSGSLPAYTIEYTLVDKLGTVNQGMQTIGVAENGLMVNLTTLAPQAKIADYQAIFDTVRETLVIRG